MIEETLRWETSVTMVSRVATADTEVAGLPDREGLAGRRAHRFVEPRRGPLGRRRRVEARPPGATPPRVRHRPAPVPRHAPRPAGAARRAQRDPRPAAEPAPRSRRRRRRGHRGLRVPRPARAARHSSTRAGDSSELSTARRTSSSTGRACGAGRRRWCGARRPSARSARASTCARGTGPCRRERPRASA